MPGELAPGAGATGLPSPGALGKLAAGLAATPAWAGRNNGPFCPQPASASTSAIKTAP